MQGKWLGLMNLAEREGFEPAKFPKLHEHLQN